ncbi:MAG: hypothetical protein LW716_21565 [Microcystis sp. 53602_E8]|nr:hypothetical protein [Microcystis sp. 53602_E8]
MHYRKIKKLLSLALITFALLLPFWEDSRVQEEAKPKLVDLIEILMLAVA